MIKNLKELMVKFADENVCIEALVQQRWGGVPECPYCGCKKSYKIEGGKRFKCADRTCHKKYSVTVGTVFEASNIKLSTWFPAMYIIMSHKKGISSVQLAKDLGVTQKTAWFMMHRIREFLKDKNSRMLDGTIEADETYMGRKYRSDYKGLSEAEIDYNLKSKQGTKSKGAVLGLSERKTGIIRVFAFDENKASNMLPAIRANVKQGANLHTDETRLYNSLEQEYHREAVKHSAREWVKPSISAGKVHTNNVENFWSIMKRGLYGIYHQVSYKHLQRYCDEFSYRYNTRDLTDGVRFELTLPNIEGRLSYKQLVYGEGNKKS